jgi:hypothetical protein
MVDLPNADALFKHFFDPWYRAEERQRRGLDAVLPDMLEFPDDRGASAEQLSPLSAEGRDVVTNQIRAMIDSARADFPRYLPVIGEPSLLWLDAFDQYWNADRIGALIGESDPADFSNDYVVTCLELGATIGHVMIASEPRLTWLPAWPYWDSGLWDASSGWILNVFHWALKRLSRDGIDQHLSEKVAGVLEMLRHTTLPTTDA